MVWGIARLRGAVAAVLTGLILVGCGTESENDSTGQLVAAESFKVGTAEALHNPSGDICVGGGATLCGRRVDASSAEAIADPLLVKAMAITGKNGQSFVLATTSNIGYFAAYKPEQGGPNGIFDMRSRISQETGVPISNIVVVSDHSHNAPDTIGIWGGVSQDYLRITAEAVVQASVQAVANQVPAKLFVAAVNQNTQPVAGVTKVESSAYAAPPAADESRGNPSNEFRVLVAEAAEDGRRLLTWMNYSPHATVWNGVATDKLTGDWAAWATQEAEARYGGRGLATLGTMGGTDWNKGEGGAQEREVEARGRLLRLLEAAEKNLQPVIGEDVLVQTTFIRESIAQPVLLLNYKPGLPTNQPGTPGDGVDVRIDRTLTPPFLQGTVFGTHISAIAIGEVFISTFPGEPFGELEHVLREQQRVMGAQAYFVLGAANDFFGYMVHEPETYAQLFEGGAAWLAGCPETEILDSLGVAKEPGCADHWTLMVSPSIGTHIICTLQDAAQALGFEVQNRNAECPVLTALDGVAGPEDLPMLPSGAWDQSHPAVAALAKEALKECASRGALSSLCANLVDIRYP
nr:hypothetical protein [Oceanococcus sp. HetDA_MAG_MS8]